MYKFIGLLVLITITGAGCSFQELKNSKSESNSTVASFKNYDDSPLSNDLINCEFRVLSDFTYKNKDDAFAETDKKVFYQTTDQEKPILLTFAGLSGENPKMKGNNGDSELIKVKDDNETIVLIERSAFGDLFLYTIFKKEKVAVWNKTYKLINTPYAHVSMGYCY